MSSIFQLLIAVPQWVTTKSKRGKDSRTSGTWPKNLLQGEKRWESRTSGVRPWLKECFNSVQICAGTFASTLVTRKREMSRLTSHNLTNFECLHQSWLNVIGRMIATCYNINFKVVNYLLVYSSRNGGLTNVAHNTKCADLPLASLLHLLMQLLWIWYEEIFEKRVVVNRWTWLGVLGTKLT